MPSAAELVAEYIRGRILSGELQFDDKLREVELCRLLEVSRTPVREAFRVLQSEGYLKHTTNRGVVVASMSREEVKAMFEMQGALAVIASRHAAERMTPQCIAQLRTINDQLLAETQEERRRSKLDKVFHQTIARQARNDTLMELLQRINTKGSMISTLLPIRKERAPITHKEHLDIIDALEAGHVENAAKYTEIHFHKALISFDKKLVDYFETL